MDMIKIHQQAIEGMTSVLHEFLGRFNKNRKLVYGFVEGKEDPSFYQGFIEQSIPNDWQVELWAAGNRDKVISLYSEFDWSRFSKNQILFFIDHDLSDFLGDPNPTDINIYITDGYSIENDVVNRSTCNRVFSEVLNLSSLLKSESDKILDLFDEQVRKYSELQIPIMSWIIYWRRQGKRPNLNNIQMKHMFKIIDGEVQKVKKPKQANSFQEYIHAQCGFRYDSSIDISSIEQEIRNSEDIKKIVRGKYLLWFFVEFILSIQRSISKFSTVLNSPPKIKVSLSQSNFIIFGGPRARIPDSLKTFIDLTYQKYIREFDSAA